MTHNPPFQAWRWDGTAWSACDSLPLSDRGFRYGMALFESMRVIRGTALFLAEHLDRLREAARQREFAVTEPALAALASFFQAGRAEGFARLYLTAGDGSPTAPVQSSRLFVLLENRPPPTGEPLRVALSSEPHHPLFGGLKTANYWANLAALQEAERRGFSEALLFNARGELISSAVGNVFLVQAGEVCTPSASSGARRGVVREWVLRQTAVRECALSLRDVEAADEIFLTNSWRGLTAVREVEGTLLAPAPVTDRLAQAYSTTMPGD